jgi:hypothetical protein
MLIMLININNRMLINILNQPVGDGRRACISGSGLGDIVQCFGKVPV